jgi:predicted nucleic acid-binding protein
LRAVVLVDSSVWFLSRPREDLLQLADGGPFAICPPIVQEIFQGAHGEHRMAKARAIIANSEMLDSPVPLERFEVAGDIYRIAREKSFTIRSSNDCLIAAIAMHHDVLLLHGDRDFDYIAQLFPLRARSVIPFASTARS